MEHVHQVVAEGADIIDIRGVPAKPGSEVTRAEEIHRVAAFIGAVQAAYLDIVIFADTWRNEVGRAACEAGAHLLNETGAVGTRPWRR
jgi:dihydropteroate synthase